LTSRLISSYIYTLSLHDALPIFSVDLTSATSAPGVQLQNIGGNFSLKNWTPMGFVSTKNSSYFEKLPYETLNPFSNHTSGTAIRSEEHTSELQSRFDLVCRLLLE